MTSEEYCYDKGIPRGSAIYFSLQGVHGDQRDCSAALATFYQELTDIIYECQDTLLAQTKFNWWRDEIAKLEKGKSDHPVIVVLQKHLEKFNLDPQRCLDLLDGVEQNLNQSPFATFAEVTIHIIHTAGIREELMLKVLNPNPATSTEIIYSLALIIELSGIVQQLRKDVKRGLIYFGDDELKQFHVTPVMLQALKTTPEIQQLLEYQHVKIERAWDKVDKEIDASQRQACKSLLIRANIAKTTLQEIKISHYRVLESFITLTPLRRWWLAFRTTSSIFSA
jgi:phytoene synthase